MGDRFCFRTGCDEPAVAEGWGCATVVGPVRKLPACEKDAHRLRGLRLLTEHEVGVCLVCGRWHDDPAQVDRLNRGEVLYLEGVR